MFAALYLSLPPSLSLCAFSDDSINVSYGHWLGPSVGWVVSQKK